METSEKIKVLSWIQASVILLSVLLFTGLIQFPSFINKNNIDSELILDGGNYISVETYSSFALIILAGVLAIVNIINKSKNSNKRTRKVAFYKSEAVGFYTIETIVLIAALFSTYILVDEIIRSITIG